MTSQSKPITGLNVKAQVRVCACCFPFHCHKKDASFNGMLFFKQQFCKSSVANSLVYGSRSRDDLLLMEIDYVIDSSILMTNWKLTAYGM